MNITATVRLEWCSVATPSVFREHLLPIDADHMTVAQRRALRQLDALAEMHGTHITRSSYRLG